jgi:hypothetical protein
MSLVRAYGSVKSRPFHCATIAGEDAPIPITARPGATSARLAALIASSAGPRVYTGTIAVPNRADGAHPAARTSGVNASLPLTSADHRSVYPAATASATTRAWSGREMSGSGIVSPQRRIRRSSRPPGREGNPIRPDDRPARNVIGNYLVTVTSALPEEAS